MIYEIKHEYKTGAVPLDAAFGVAKDGDIVNMLPVFRDISDGDIDGCASDGVKVIGIAQNAPASGGTVAFTPVDAGTLILADWVKGSAYAVTDLGQFFAMTVTSGDLAIDLSDTSHDAVQLVAVEPSYTNAAGTAGRAWFRFIPGVRQWDAIETA